MACSCAFFFFQAEDGIRDRNVTGVQTCALPISLNNRGFAMAAVVNGDDAEDIGKRIELRQPHINRGANRPDENQGALWLLGLAWAVFDKVQLCHVFLAFLFYNCCHALTATDAHGGKTQLAALALEAVRQSHQHAGAGRADWVAQGDTRTPSVQAGIIPRQVPFLQHSERLRRESLVELNRIQVIQANAGALQRLLGGWNWANTHGLWCNAGDSPALEAQHRGKTQLSGLLAGGDNHGCGAIILRGCIARGHGCFLIDLAANGALLSQLFCGGSLAWTFIGVHDGLLLAALFRRNRHWHDFFLEPVLRLRLQSTLMRGCCQLILCFAGELVLAANVFRSFDHAARNRVLLTAGGLTSLCQAVAQLHVAALHAPANSAVHGVFGARHGFCAASDNEVSCADCNVCSCGHNCLQARTATAIQLHARYFLTQSRVQRDDAAERRCCTIRASLAQDDVIDVLRSHPGALHDGIDHGGSQIFYWYVAEDPAVAADWGAQRGAQDNVIIVLVGHRRLLS